MSIRILFFVLSVFFCGALVSQSFGIVPFPQGSKAIDNIDEQGTLNGIWIREFTESTTGSIYNERSGRNIKQTLSGRISISFSDSQFSVSCTVINEDSSSSESLEGEYIISEDAIKFYSRQKKPAELKYIVNEDVLVLTDFVMNKFILYKFSNNEKQISLEGEYKRVRNKKGCGCGH